MEKQAIERTVKRTAKRAGLGSWGVHRFRVTFATQLYDDGTDLERIRILMGHESIETTRRYVVVSDRMNRVRLRSNRQHEVLGTRPEGFPRWAREMEGKRNGPVLPSR
jgi:site-specific recombinase XerD